MKSEYKFALKLSKENIHLLVQSPDGSQSIIGGSDPNKPTLTHDLRRLLGQLQALTDHHPVVDVLLPNDLILCQRVAVEKPFSPSTATSFIGKTCDLANHEVMIALGEVTDERNQTIAAVTSKTITETRIFLKNAGFYTKSFMAADPVAGFNDRPIFVSDKVPWNPSTIKRTVTAASWTIAAGFLIALVQFFSNPEPGSPDANLILKPEIAKFISTPQRQHSTHKNDQKPLMKINRPTINRLTALDNDNIFSKEAPPTLGSLEDSGVTQSAKPVKIKVNEFGEFAEAPKQISFGYREDNYTNSYPKKMSHITSPKGDNILYLYLTPKLKMQLLRSSIASLSPFTKEDVKKFDKVSMKPIYPQIEKPSVKKDYFTSLTPSSLTPIYDDPEWLKENNLLTENEVRRLEASINFNDNDFEVLRYWKEKPNLKPKTFDYAPNIQVRSQPEKANIIELYRLTPKELVLSNKLKPAGRPQIISSIKLLAEPTLSSGAITFSEIPMTRPSKVVELVWLDPSSVNISAKATKRPTFPRRASVESNATINNILELNRTNLIGIFGTEFKATALIRLSSGRVIRVKVGDQFQGWQVLNIHKDKIDLANGLKLETLRLPG